jgi:hypothetical protein
MSTVSESCDHDNHSLGCQCHQGGPVMADIPPAVGESARQTRVRERLVSEQQGLVKDRFEFVPEPEPPLTMRERVRSSEFLDVARERTHTPDWFCDRAKSLVGGDRRAIYGDALDNFTRTGKLWAVVLGVEEVTAEQVAMCMVLLKLDRLCSTPNHEDSWVDMIGYAALGGDIAMRPGRHL